jgi:hypothetical protein
VQGIPPILFSDIFGNNTSKMGGSEDFKTAPELLGT